MKTEVQSPAVSAAGTLALTDYSLPPHSLYAPDFVKGEPLTTIKVGDVEIAAPARVVLPEKFNPQLIAQPKYIPPAEHGQKSV